MKSTSWVEELYSLQGSLMDPDPVAIRGRLAPEVVAQHYQSDLKTIFGSVSRPAIMNNSRESPIYALVFASQNTRAARRIMDGVIRKFDG
jgi:hypothetical protein